MTPGGYSSGPPGGGRPHFRRRKRGCQRTTHGQSSRAGGRRQLLRALEALPAFRALPRKLGGHFFGQRLYRAAEPLA